MLHCYFVIVKNDLFPYFSAIVSVKGINKLYHTIPLFNTSARVTCCKMTFFSLCLKLRIFVDLSRIHWCPLSSLIDEDALAFYDCSDFSYCLSSLFLAYLHVCFYIYSLKMFKSWVYVSHFYRPLIVFSIKVFFFCNVMKGQ